VVAEIDNKAFDLANVCGMGELAFWHLELV
jgi:hypothetical protein